MEGSHGDLEISSMTDLHANAQLPIAQLEPSVEVEHTCIKGVVTLIWPYSSSTKSISILLVEPDFRLRRNQGQVRITFHNSSAEAVAKSKISSGDELVLSLLGVSWAKDEGKFKIPGRGIEWELQFAERVIIQVRCVEHIG